MVSRKTCQCSFGKKKKTTQRSGGKKKRAALKGRRVAYVRGKGASVRKIHKVRNRKGKIVWKYSTGKTVPKSRRKYNTKARAVGRKKVTHHKKRKRTSFGSFGQGRAPTLLQMMGPYHHGHPHPPYAGSFGVRRRTTRRRPAIRRRY